MMGEFSVYQYFANDDYEEVLRFVDGRTAVETAKRLTTSIGGLLGTTKRVIITDDGDCCCFEWLHDRGVVFPPPSGTVRTCRVCGCTDADCSGCIARTGEACHWVEADRCSACPP